MTQTALAPAAPAPTAPDRTRRTLRAVAIAACVPYLGLKVAWLAGSRVGIPDGSSLLDHRAAVAVANGVTVLMDACVIVLAVALTRPWGRRLPAWLLTVPVWAATGLLAPIMTGFPVQLVVRALGGGDTTGDGDEVFLDSWVFGLVYGGFIVQGLALGALFALYARERWGRLWQGRVWDVPRALLGTGAQKAVAVGAAVLAVPPLAGHLLWAFGGTTGLDGARIDDRGSDFTIVEAQAAAFLVVAVAAALLLAFRRGPALRLAVPLTAAWVGSAASACWAAWQGTAALVVAEGADERPTALMNLTYACGVIVGVLVAGLVARLLLARSAAVGRLTG
ncbi:hypothetical protein [Streptomyces sp. enrichment culture]|uniref:hypothetical protein n=1 Tax=Streptomyces sp. enrichment culture TaxID=1795815 RepID=UPI003F564B70